jgi:hypothetical protein
MTIWFGPTQIPGRPTLPECIPPSFVSDRSRRLESQNVVYPVYRIGFIAAGGSSFIVTVEPQMKPPIFMTRELSKSLRYTHAT